MIQCYGIETTTYRILEPGVIQRPRRFFSEGISDDYLQP